MATLPPLQGQIELGEELGRGAFGVVHRGRLADGRAVAVKLHGAMPAEEEARVQREADLLSGLRHPRLVSFHGLYRGPQGELALVYELVDGVELEARLADGPLTLVETLAICTGIAEGLDALHQVGLVHRDLKPGNVMLGPDGSPRLIDYGMLRPTEAGRTLTATGAVVGTPAYMAPEQITGIGRPTPALDQYALGCVVFECLAGLTPFAGNLSAILDGHLKQPPPRLRERAPHLPAGLQAVLERMLAKSPEERFASCGEALRALDAARRHVGPVSEATQVVDGVETKATRTVSSPKTSGTISSTAPLPGPAPAPAPSEAPPARSQLPRVVMALLVTAGIAVGFLREPTSAKQVPGEAKPAWVFPDPPRAPDLPTPIDPKRRLRQLSWWRWTSSEEKTGLRHEPRHPKDTTVIETIPVPVGEELLAVATDKGGIALLERAPVGQEDAPEEATQRRLKVRASWRLAPIPSLKNGQLLDDWYTPYLAPGREADLWLTAGAREDPPVTLRLPRGHGKQGHWEEPLRPAVLSPSSGWETKEQFPAVLADQSSRIEVEGLWPSREGDAWLGLAANEGSSSWVSLNGEAPRPLSFLAVRAGHFPSLAQLAPNLHTSPREIPMRPFRAGGGWVRGAALLIKPSGRLPRALREAAERFVRGLPGSEASTRGHAAYTIFSAEEPGTAKSLAARSWELPLLGYPEAYPHPFEGGFLMMHRRELLYFPAMALQDRVDRESAIHLDTFERAWCEERYEYPTATMTYDEETGLDLVVWENFRFVHGADLPQRIVWYRYPEFGPVPGTQDRIHLGPRKEVSFLPISLADMGTVLNVRAIVDNTSTENHIDNSKHAGFRGDQRLPGKRLWVLGFTAHESVNRLLVLDLKFPRVEGYYEAGNVRAIVSGPVVHPGNEPGTWEVYFTNRGGWVFGTRLLGTRPEDG
jgi:serine/threonine protein kinase